MWRTEERLGFWLAGGRVSEKQGRAGRLRRLSFRTATGAVKGLPLTIQSRTASLDEALSADAGVHDGLGALSELSCQAGSPAWPPVLSGERAVPAAAHGVDLLEEAVARRISMPDGRRTRIRQGRLIMSPRMRLAVTGIRSAGVQALVPLQEGPAEVKDGSRLLLAGPAVRGAGQISELPHRRESANLDNIDEAERNSFLREAEVLRRVPPGRAELIALFRHVPIEMISRLRFLADKKQILYSIPGEPKRTQTRVHDMAVVRDTASQEIHMVPHRTQSRSVSLT